MKYDFEINDYIGGWGSGNRQWVREQLQRCGARPVTVRISSLGGALDHGLDIRSQFVQHGQVTVHLFGLTASAATIIAMGAQTVKMSRHAAILIHKCSNWVEEWGQMNADELQRVIEQLQQQKRRQDALDVVIAQCYAERMKRPLKEIVDLLKEERWLTAEEALGLGLIDEIINDEPERRTRDFSGTAPSDIQALGMPPVPESLAEFCAKDAGDSPWRAIIARLDALWRAITGWQEEEPGNRIAGRHRGEGTDEGHRGEGTDGMRNGNENHTPHNNITMKKMYQNVCALLALSDGFSVEDGRITMTEDQVQRIEDHMSSLADQVKTLKGSAEDLENRRKAAEKAADDLRKIVDELKKQPADDPDARVHDEGAGETIDTAALAKFMARV